MTVVDGSLKAGTGSRNLARWYVRFARGSVCTLYEPDMLRRPCVRAAIAWRARAAQVHEVLDTQRGPVRVNVVRARAYEPASRV